MCENTDGFMNMIPRKKRSMIYIRAINYDEVIFKREGIYQNRGKL